MVVPGMQDGRFITNYSSNSSLNKEYFHDVNKTQNVLREYVQSNAEKILQTNINDALTSAQAYRNDILPKKPT